MGEAEMPILREIYADWERGDYRRTDYFHPDFELVYAPDFLDEGAFQGLEEAGRGWRQWLGQWSSWRATPTRFIDAGDRVVVLVDLHGVAKSTGMELSREGGNHWEFRDGLPVRLVIYARRANALRDAGLDPDAP